MWLTCGVWFDFLGAICRNLYTIIHIRWTAEVDRVRDSCARFSEKVLPYCFYDKNKLSIHIKSNQNYDSYKLVEIKQKNAA